MAKNSYQFKRFGAEWSEYRDGWGGAYKTRFLLVTWRFGDIWQSCVEVHQISVDDETPHVWVCLNPQKTINEAMKHAKDYADQYKILTVEEVFTRCFNDYKTLYRTRRHVIDTLFMSGGNYEWMDGSMTRRHEPEPPEKENERKREREEHYLKISDRFSDKTSELYKFLQKQIQDREDTLKIGPITEEEYKTEKDDDNFGFKEQCQHPHAFYPVSEGYANITKIPDNVLPEWLDLSYEAAKLLAASVNCEHCNEMFARPENPIIGAKIVKELEQRFPRLLASAPERATNNP
jgi:hypothetical protein